MKIDTSECLLASSQLVVARRWPRGRQRRRAGDDQAVESQDRGLSGLHRIRQGRVQEDPSRRRASSSRTSRTRPTRRRSRWRSSAPTRPTSSSTGPARTRRGWSATGWRSTSRELGNAEGGFRHSLSEGWQASFMFDGKNYGIPTDAVSKYFYYNKSVLRRAQPDAADDLRRAARPLQDRSARSIRAWCRCPLGNSERWKLNHYITMFNERVLGADATAADYALTAPEDQLFTNPGYVEAWQKVLDMKDGRLLAGRAQRHLAGSLALDVLGRAVADDLLRHLVRRHLRRRRLHRLRHVPHARDRGRQGRSRTPTSWCRRA